MHSQHKVIDCYNKTAGEYVKRFIDELTHKPFDRMLLKNFAEEKKVKIQWQTLDAVPGQTTKYLYEHGIETLSALTSLLE